MDDEIHSCKTHSEYTQSYQVVIPVPFVSFHSKSFGLAYCWVQSHWKITADLFNAQHSIQFACIKKSFISARVFISTFIGLTSSSRMACWVCTLTVKVPLLHQTNHVVPSEWWYKQQHFVPFVSCWELHQSEKAALKAIAEVQASADKIYPYNVSSFNEKPASTFLLVVTSVDWISRIRANANLQITNNFRRGSPSHFNVGGLHELIVGPTWNPTFKRAQTENKSLTRIVEYNKLMMNAFCPELIVECSYIALSFQYFSSDNFWLVVEFNPIPHSEGECNPLKYDGAQSAPNSLFNDDFKFIVVSSMAHSPS